MNVKDARFQYREQLISNTLYTMLAKRRFDISPTEICRQSGVARSTFYLHYSACDCVQQHELKLAEEFWARLSQRQLQKYVMFMILLGFVRDKRAYFEATIPNANFWLLEKIFAELSPSLQAKDGSQRAYDQYALQQIGLISDWVKYEHLAPEKISYYARKMANVAEMRR